MIKFLRTLCCLLLCCLLVMPVEAQQRRSQGRTPARTQVNTKGKSTKKTQSKKVQSKKAQPQKRQQAQTRQQPREERNSKYARNTLDLYQIHNLSMWGGAGYSGLVNKYSDNKFVGGGGGLLGVGYEWHYKRFMLAIGPEFRLFSSMDKINQSPIVVPGTGTSSDPAVSPVLVGQKKYYDFRNFTENQIVGQVMLPVMLGAQFDDTGVPLYFLVGAKVGYTLMDNFSQKSDLETWIEDPMAMDPRWRVHNLGTEKYKASGTNQPGLDVAVSAEIGVNLNDFFSADWNKANEKRRYPWHLRVAAFVDYGLPILKNGGQEPMVTADEWKASSISLHASDRADSKLNSLLVGAKFTALMQLNEPKKPKPMNPYIVTQLRDARTGAVLNGTGANMEITSLRTGRVTKKVPTKNGMVIQRMAPGNYDLYVSKSGYLPHDTVRVMLIENENNNLKRKLDTTYIYLTPEPVFLCLVRDSKTGERISATLTFLDKETSKEIAVVNYDAAADNAVTKLPLGGNYGVKIESVGHIANMFEIGTQGVDDMMREYMLDPVEKHRTYIIQNLFFATNKTVILPTSEASMQELYEWLHDNPEIRIRIIGHTDWVGSEKSNQILSEGRANSVKQSMVDRGIDPSRIETEGKGESQPIDTNETEEGRQNNRRVEFMVL